MPCRKGVWKLSTLWLRVTSDMSFLIMAFLIVVQFMHRILVDNTLLVVEEICAMDQQFGHSILLSFEPVVETWYFSVFESTVFYDTLKCQWSMLTWNVVYWSVLHLISDSARIRYSRRQAWAEDIYIGPTLRFIVCLRHWAVWSLQVMGTYSWKLLEKSLD